MISQISEASTVRPIHKAHIFPDERLPKWLKVSGSNRAQWLAQLVSARLDGTDSFYFHSEKRPAMNRSLNWFLGFPFQDMWAWRHAKLRLSDSFWPQTTAECWKINFGGVSPSVESVEFPEIFFSVFTRWSSSGRRLPRWPDILSFLLIYSWKHIPLDIQIPISDVQRVGYDFGVKHLIIR